MFTLSRSNLPSVSMQRQQSLTEYRTPMPEWMAAARPCTLASQILSASLLRDKMRPESLLLCWGCSTHTLPLIYRKIRSACLTIAILYHLLRTSTRPEETPIPGFVQSSIGGEELRRIFICLCRRHTNFYGPCKFGDETLVKLSLAHPLMDQCRGRRNQVAGHRMFPSLDSELRTGCSTAQYSTSHLGTKRPLQLAAKWHLASNRDQMSRTDRPMVSAMEEW